MKGHIRQRGPETWLLKFDVGRDPLTGKRITRYATVHGGKRDAQRELSKYLAQVGDGVYVDPTKLTLGDYLMQHWLPHVRNQVTGSAADRYSDIVNKHLVPAIGKHRLARLSPAQVQAYYDAELAGGRRAHPLKKSSAAAAGLSARTVRLHHKVLNQALRHAVKLQWIARNPCDAASPPRVEHKEMPALDHDQTAAVIRAAAGSRIYIAVLLALTTGMRRGEILGLRWRDLGLDAGQLSVSQALEQTRRGLVFKPPKTERSRRMIILPALTIEGLRVHKTQQREEYLQLGFGKDEDDLVVTEITVATDSTGRREIARKPMTPDHLSKDFCRLARRLKLKVRFHDLRHTHATHLLKAGVHPKVASERLGHASVAITLDTYSHVLPGLQEDAARGVDAALRKALER
jgi:integrase